MEGEFGSDLITISDESGNDFVLEHVDTIEIDGTFYMAFLPTDLDEDDDDFGLIILKVVTEGEDEILVIIEDEQLLDELFEKFLERLADYDEE